MRASLTIREIFKLNRTRRIFRSLTTRMNQNRNKESTRAIWNKRVSLMSWN